MSSLSNSASWTPPSSRLLSTVGDGLTGLSLELARLNPALMGEYCLEVNGKPLTAQPFHLEWQDLAERHRNLILYAPMDHGKSTQLSVLRPLWLLGNNPDLRLAVISDTASQSQKWLGQIKANILHNDRLKQVFPGLRPGADGPWHQNAIVIERSAAARLAEKDYSIQALGVGGALLGARLDGVIMDDVITPENVQTEHSRRDTIDWFLQTVVGRVVQGGFIHIIGTAWHELDLPHWLEKERPGEFHIATYQAGVAPCSWPERWPPERLAARAQLLGDVEFSRQMLNIPLGEATNYFKVDGVNWCRDACTDPDTWWIGFHRQHQQNGSDSPFLWTSAGVDLGASRASTASRTAIAVVGLAQDGQTKHLLHLRSGHWVGADLIRQVVEVHQMHRPAEWVVESNAAQLHMADLLGNAPVLQSVGAEAEDAGTVRVIAQYTGENKQHAMWGIRGLAPDFDAHQWRLPRGRPEVEELIGEMRRYTPLEHTGDRLIALWLADSRIRTKGGPLLLSARSS